ncbi:tetratricopeptide repeat protein [Marinomonas ostreistagni]|uniref:Tetratricopeptide repeat protein n=1 Tax=Marinomonas ostreistagni TaxID=359209 RepID=A0ABS0Z954_9GAMM|nr:tetratricopeptide repeat protein [Marinomonas ostreistagni]MBJ7550177.1 tetratricopeptide repeat protein [Marinomonas ostreistagni]
MKNKIIFLGLSSFIIQGCSTFEGASFSDFKDALSGLTNQVTMLFTDNVIAFEPPPKSTLSGYESVILKSNIGSRNRVMRSIYEELSSSEIESDKYFKDVSFYSQGENVKPKTAVFDLKINDSIINREDFRENRFKCPGDKLVKSCDSSEAYQYTVSCYKLVASINGSYNINDHKMRVIDKDDFSFQTEEKSCEDSMSSKKNSSELKQMVEIKAGAEIAKKYIPKEVERPKDLIEKDDSLPKEVQNKMSSIYDMATDKGVSYAKKAYEALHEKFPNNATVKYNIAYCNLLLGNYETASSQFKSYLQVDSDHKDDAIKYLNESEDWLRKGVYKVNRN